MSSRNQLVYSERKINAATLRRLFLKWRATQNLPLRCDEPTCCFHTQSLEWNGKPLPLILDHKNGVNSDNRPKNLRFLCPNCDSQLETRAGGNKGRVKKSSGGFGIFFKQTGVTHYVLPAPTAQYIMTGGDAKMTIGGRAPKND